MKDFEQRPTAKELLQHPFIKAVPNNPEEVRGGLTEALTKEGKGRGRRERLCRGIQGEIRNDGKDKG